MRVTKKDLDSEIVKKLDQLDPIINSNEKDGFISFDGTNFYIKKTNEMGLKKVFSHEEIYSLQQDCLNNRSDSNFTNSRTQDLRKSVSNKYNEVFENSFNINLKERNVYELSAEAVLSRNINQNIFILTSDGHLTKISNSGRSYTTNILGYMNNQFSLNATVLDIVDIEYSQNIVYLAIKNKGIYKFFEDSNSLELFSVFSNIKFCRIIKNKMFVITDELVNILSLESGKRLEKSSRIKNSFQVPSKCTNTETKLFLTGKAVGIAGLDNLLHIWELDPSEISLNNIDHKISKNNEDYRYLIKSICVNSNRVFIIGNLEKDIFIWIYDLNNLSNFHQEIIISDNNYDFRNITSAEIINSTLFIGVDDRIVQYNIENSKKNIFKASSIIKDLLFYNDQLYCIFKNTVKSLTIPMIESESEICEFEIMNSESSCNNIDIIVVGGTKNETVELVDEIGNILIPSYQLITEVNGISNIVIKILNSTTKKISLRIKVTKDQSKIYGIACNRNKLYLR